jgi:CheY-like chemotaxis protein
LHNSDENKKPRLLLVNDTQFLLYSYEMQLEDTFQITTAENGLQALQIVTSEPPNYFDIILLDINMPIMDGFEACSRITDYLYQEDSLFSINPQRASYK